MTVSIAVQFYFYRNLITLLVCLFMFTHVHFQLKHITAPFTDVAIGFSQTTYTFSEANDFATVEVEVTSGTLGLPIQIDFEVPYTDGTAVRKFIKAK